ncbi:sn-glycerol-3-phosphate ABC transporter ATP-binding protein UgpC [Legionella sp. MW5194]|uniref:ABC transporter ATP-binding protein n=1 Tax=Legionella sp. MW5194 TaxID=2662448 RepID=UPI00193DD581|nr:sn-glycerol-3-phosphate ABC transporter ATP-binding protein UgpC [Legionella sp. MW5194]QRN03661.1 sn-glycerol-3-phosphate ABC transporter ATP-binding protein UgpC [Legionella sp. MW5194]
MATVELVNISKYHGQHRILEQISLSIEQGEFVAVVGPSGCGKSTLLRLVAGLDTVTSGKILIDNQCVNEIPPAKRNMAMVFQSYALYPHMTVFDNMAYGLKMRGVLKHAIDSRVKEVAAMLQLSDYLKRLPRELSGGQKQRVAMGRAIVRSPSVFLFDEPLSNLDAKLRTEMRHEIKKLHQQLQTTCLYVTHDQTEAMTMASRILVLNQGRIEQIGAPQTLYQQPASLFVAGFTGHYPINFLSGTIDLSSRQFISATGVSFSLPEHLTPAQCDEEVILGVRPENLEMTVVDTPGAIPVHIDFVDNMGSDKLVHTRSHCGRAHFAVRTRADTEICEGRTAIRLNLKQAHWFDKNTGKRLGGWND